MALMLANMNNFTFVFPLLSWFFRKWSPRVTFSAWNFACDLLKSVCGIISLHWVIDVSQPNKFIRKNTIVAAGGSLQSCSEAFFCPNLFNMLLPVSTLICVIADDLNAISWFQWTFSERIYLLIKCDHRTYTITLWVTPNWHEKSFNDSGKQKQKLKRIDIQPMTPNCVMRLKTKQIFQHNIWT